MTQAQVYMMVGAFNIKYSV